MLHLRSIETPPGNTWLEIIIRAILTIIFFELEKSTPFKRKIHPDEIWLYRNPRTEDYVPISVLWPVIILIPLLVILFFFLITRDKNDISQGILSLTLSLGLNGVFTDIIKLVVGRPRPDFFWRCFPDGEMNSEMECTGDLKSVMDGRKSFPSGHSSFSFASMGFLSWYIMGKLHVFNDNGRGQSWRLIISVLPLLGALIVALSRTCDYHHHWQDVLVGSLIGLGISYMCYRQYYPTLTSNLSHRSYFSRNLEQQNLRTAHNVESSSGMDTKPLMTEDKDIKWI